MRPASIIIVVGIVCVAVLFKLYGGNGPASSPPVNPKLSSTASASQPTPPLKGPVLRPRDIATSRPVELVARNGSLVLKVSAELQANVDKPYRVRCTVRNEGPNPAHYFWTEDDRRDFTIGVMDESGAPAQPTREGNAVLIDAPIKHGYARSVSSGEQLTREYDLNQFFQLRSGKQYWLYVGKVFNEFSVEPPEAVEIDNVWFNVR
jgi:hypothetical protein